MRYLLLAGSMLAAGGAAVSAQESIPVVEIVYSNNSIDYIPTSEISSISHMWSLETDNPHFATVQSLFDKMKEIGENHREIGYPAIMLATDLQTADMYSKNNSYNWFSGWQEYNLNPDYVYNYAIWKYLYSYIRIANDIVKALQSPADDEENLYLAQALAMRSFSYWNLVQLFAHNFHFAPDADAIPLVTETNNEAAFAGTPVAMSTTRRVYDLILSDIDKAIELLKNKNIDAALFDIDNAQRYIDLGVAYGLRARYNLTMHRYAEAAADARLAIESTGARPMVAALAGLTGFNDAKASNWMWGITVNESDAAALQWVGCYASHISSVSNGYATNTEVSKCCGSALWNYLSQHPQDVRRNWFVDNVAEATALIPAEIRALRSALGSLPHTNIKFGVYGRNPERIFAAEDIPLMRVEEMYLIEAEGMAMSGNTAQGLKLLNAFVQKYRNPAYNCTATDKEDIQNEVLWQRRLEFWGEGLAYFDMVRLQRDLDRCDPVLDTMFKLRIRGGSDHFLYKKSEKYIPKIQGFTTPEYVQPVAGNEGIWND
ncbi:MAG: RagB/SusD family nutrient uptake outer membrane protein [Bacteroidales bacterium]|nr:RagB/SusD family nutrient uptake outer membrane protein [Bacteroidales bacterium]